MSTVDTHPARSSQQPEGRLLWVDCEFTGLSTRDDVILEIAAVATDYRLEQLGQYGSFIHHDEAEVKRLVERNDWWATRPDHQALMLAKVREMGKPTEQVEAELASFADALVGESIILAGNSIYNDRAFLVRDFNDFAANLSYRMVDVSSIKLIARALLGKEYQKRETHRAADDIQESIEELRFLLRAMGSDTIRGLISPPVKTTQNEDLQPRQD